MRRFKIFYADGSTRTDQDDLSELPRRGVQVISSESQRVGRLMVDKSDYYLLLDGRDWIGVMLDGFLDYALYELDRITVVLKGQMLPRREWLRVHERAMNDPYLPPKSGYEPGEVKA